LQAAAKAAKAEAKVAKPMSRPASAAKPKAQPLRQQPQPKPPTEVGKPKEALARHVSTSIERLGVRHDAPEVDLSDHDSSEEAAPAAAVSLRGGPPRLHSERINTLSSAAVRNRALAELNGSAGPLPSNGQPASKPLAAPALAPALAPAPAAARARTAGNGTRPLAKLFRFGQRTSAELPSELRGADVALVGQPRAQSANSILSAVGGLDDVQSDMLRRRESAAATAKALGPSGGGGAAAISGKARGITLQWAGTRSFLQQHRGI